MSLVVKGLIDGAALVTVVSLVRELLVNNVLLVVSLVIGGIVVGTPLDSTKVV